MRGHNEEVRRKRLANFKKLSFGLFVHFGLYSILGKGEWIQKIRNIPHEEYEKLSRQFNPKKSWARDIVLFAKRNGFKYITITTKHHDGFCLYDSKGLTAFDSVHSLASRDLLTEFVSECNREGIVPFFYHSIIDWKMEELCSTEKCLEYFEKSIKLLCSNYGKIGGFWFDGDWNEYAGKYNLDNIYKTIRELQPEAVVVNNSGLDNAGQRKHKEIDVVTYERMNRFSNVCKDGDYCAEMCQTLNSHWGCAKNDLNYKSVREIILDICECKRAGVNYLLNVGLMGNGTIRNIEREIVNKVGDWLTVNKEALYDTESYIDNIEEGYFVLKKNNTFYVFLIDVPMEISPHNGCIKESISLKNLRKPQIKSAVCLDDKDTKINLKSGKNELMLEIPLFKYGTDCICRIVKI